MADNQPSDVDRADFVKRLQNYGLDEAALIAPSLVTTSSSVMSLRGGAGSSPFQPIKLRTNDFNDLNRWIGTPDRVFDELDPFVDGPKAARIRQLQAEVAVDRPELRQLRTDASAERREQLTRAVRPEPATTQAGLEGRRRLADDPQVAREVARAFLFGDARNLQSLAGWLGTQFPSIDVAVWPFMNVTIKSGSVLEFGPGPNVLIAWNLTIETGGKLRSHGHLKVDATRMQKSSPLKFVAINSALDNLVHMKKEVSRG
jgi:hypothetical protein